MQNLFIGEVGVGGWGVVLGCSPLVVINDKRQFVQLGPGTVGCIFSGRVLRLVIRVCTMITNNVLRSFFHLVNVVLKI